MISRKDSLLVRPWEQRKYLYHRQKVKSALPAIDNRPPPFRAHVAVKWKKQQKETERCSQIERENFILWQKMNDLAKTSRIDNVWKTPQPNFLNRVAMYEHIDEDIPDIEELLRLDLEEIDDEQLPRSRKSSCYACNSKRTVDVAKLQIPEERVPWDPAKKPVGRGRSRSVPARKPSSIPSIKDCKHFKEPTRQKPMSATRKIKSAMDSKDLKSSNSNVSKPPQNIVLSRGYLNLKINFPSDSTVKYQEGNVERILMKGICFCKNKPWK
nr:unnamed protein product [Callosobruchus chinensis]